ncbi:MAG: hypothetical protein EOM80_09805 [Erysipelotrichia bacterium]|nr:hypothetical protein [Erysipelotrichia bacterium]
MNRREKPKKRIKGVVDRVTGGIVVVLVRHPQDPDSMMEVYVPIEKFKNNIPEEGDQVSVLIEE